ncbi:MAG TPA: 23S rRNA (uracil(1939)-C(5))-methyltransferase RlmD [Flavobacteriales bacterium]|nr:23S rRNA (uracil(1939)-C(5))-methyltransferase RlmD [Flavobacteriales bacterium]
MAKKKLPLLENVPITGWAAKGKSIAKVDGMVVFVTGAVPGDHADLQVTRMKKSFAEARLQRLVTPSPNRETPFCKHFGTCGGCTWQDLAYPTQLEFKRQEVVDNLVRLGGLDLPGVQPILASPKSRFYRNKLEYTFSDQRWFTSEELAGGERITDRKALGYHLPGRFDKVIDISECWLQPEPSNSIRNFIRRYSAEHDLGHYHIRKHEGWLRTLTIRTATTGEIMVLLAFGHEDREKREALMAAVAKEFPAITSLLWCINPKKNDTIWDLDIHVFQGRDHIIEELPDAGFPALRFQIDPKSFFQTNPEQTLAMYELVRQLADLRGDELVYDLYCGAGSISLFLARHCARVVGAEIVPEAVADAHRNAALNSIGNVAFEAGDLKDLLDASFIARHGKPDVLVTDPPRAGMHEAVVARIREMAPPRIVYVSCNPATQARDLALLKDLYRITHVQPVDMFPHTSHVENVVCLERS